MNKTKFSNNVKHSIFLGYDQWNREIIRGWRIINDFCFKFMFLETFWRRRNFWNMNWRSLFSCFSFNKTEYVGSVCIVMNKGSTKCTSMTLNHLLFSTFDKVKLDMSIDSFSSIWCWNSEKSSPFFIVWKNITDYLSFLKLSWSLENFNLFLGFVCNAYMINWACCNNS